MSVRRVHGEVTVTAKKLAAWTALAVTAVACNRSATVAESAWLVVRPQTGTVLAVANAHATGPAVRAVTASGGTLVVELDLWKHGNVVVTADGACPLIVERRELQPGTVTKTLAPFFVVAKPLVNGVHRPFAEVGFDTAFELRVETACPQAHTGTVTWRQVGGAPLDGLSVADEGRRFSARTPKLETALGHAPAWGIVPLSARTRSSAELDVTWTSPGKPDVTEHVTVSAAPRSRGLANVTLGADLYLGGSGWHVTKAPATSHAAVTSHDGFAVLAPDARGAFTLADAAERSLRVVAGKYDETPLDCGRSDCHADIARVAPSSPMATVLQRGLDAPFAGDYPACAVGCHAVGEPGLDDGGFTAVATSLGESVADLPRRGFHELAPALQRLSGVGCLACHGPGQIPEPGTRHALLRADVCATCHDAPPRYGHVAALATSRMATADHDPRTREAPCARCHTTWGALAKPEWKPPADAAPAGIACAACHAVHPAGHGAPVLGQTCEAALPRDGARPALLTDVPVGAAKKSNVCLGCHTPTLDDASPTATAAALVNGRGGLDPASGAPLNAVAPTGAVEGGCVGCHSGGPAELGGKSHGFHAARAAGASDPTIAERARGLASRISTGGASPGPLHADGPKIDRTTARGRALWDVALVLEDPAADAHNAAYARTLLDAAEKTLGPGPHGDAPRGQR